MRKLQMTALAVAAAALLAGGCQSNDEKMNDLEARVAKLEQAAKDSATKQDLEKLEQGFVSKKELPRIIQTTRGVPLQRDEATAKLVAAQQAKARARMREDDKAYTEAEQEEIEKLYQVANSKWGTPEAVESLKTMVSKYKKSNRTGCAILYLGQMSKGEEQIKHLEDAIANYGDCFYGDGVQVGAYARYYLAAALLEKGEKEKAAKTLEEVKAMFPGAVAHGGRDLAPLLDEALARARK